MPHPSLVAPGDHHDVGACGVHPQVVEPGEDADHHTGSRHLPHVAPAHHPRFKKRNNPISDSPSFSLFVFRFSVYVRCSQNPELAQMRFSRRNEFTSSSLHLKSFGTPPTRPLPGTALSPLSHLLANPPTSQWTYLQKRRPPRGTSLSKTLSLSLD